jgi:hypothetical protein
MKTVQFAFGLMRWWAMGAVGFVVGNSQAKSLSVDLTLTPADHETNRLDTTVTAFAFGSVVRDTDEAIITGNILTKMEISYNSLTHEVFLHSIGFYGGSIHLSTMTFTLPFGRLGKIETHTMNISGIPISPSGSRIVTEGFFEGINHKVLFNQGLITTYGLGMTGDLFDPIRMDLSVEPIQIVSKTWGNVSVVLENSDGYQATYRIRLLLPMVLSEDLVNDKTALVVMQGLGNITATGTFILPACLLNSDLTGNDCQITLDDLLVFSGQWLAFSNQRPCPLPADFSGDCSVGLNDFAILAEEWLAQGI